jgi:putative CocE/NonD family hydrolase
VEYVLRYGCALLGALAALAAAPALASAAGVDYPDAEWTEAWINSPSQDGGDATLHADVLRPKSATAADKTPVILSIGPYFNHSGQTGPAGPAEGTNYDPVGPNAGPSERFQDFVEGSGLLKKGYTFVMVDLRGFGGSNGCLDWSGPGEQADVVNAVKWAAGQSWSNGKVGMYGKSYDGLTGLIGVDHRPAGLAAVVSQEPVYDDYRYLYGDGMRRLNSLATPALYDGIAATPGPLTDSPDYTQSSLNDPACLGQNFAAQAGDDNHDSAFWKLRNLIPGAAGSDVPLFLTQGLTENNTVADGLQQYLDNHSGYERAWLGPWEHVRGNERCAEGDGSTGCNDSNVGRLKMGRAGWFDEVMRFYDRFLKGAAPTVADPPIAVQTNDGKWRSEAQWPPADKSQYTTALRAGSYDDTAQSYSTGSEDDPTSNSGVWTVSKPLPYDVHLAGSGSASVNVTTSVPNANLVIDVYDLDANGVGPLITRQGHLVRQTGDSTIPLELWSADWKLAAGHRIGVRVTDNNQDWFLLASPTPQTVAVRGGSVTLPFLRYRRTGTIQGDPGVQLEDYLADTVTVPADTLGSSQADFTLPPALKDAPRGSVYTGDYVPKTGKSRP